MTASETPGLPSCWSAEIIVSKLGNFVAIMVDVGLLAIYTGLKQELKNDRPQENWSRACWLFSYRFAGIRHRYYLAAIGDIAHTNRAKV
jgi:hypothetical protein